ncbi:2,4-dihydroxyhept-2-ene-1,7-dioic acid aldolase [Brachybacterium vulturis]|uniref:2,4-dihydroxyhept-2-ene-1,7-dioic acid aldolase n=1 Tax=Brachybacterium vulturis TaxID=2017484 RepID=A0A291GS32_9MICO|nr:aldolase/citrate lyase family protein [Brachybacterium vulturis]ATG53018.1 2,4-dihydroxyhept-2-ene-1,7-dioic acid aldolase [Brachybacterium vulturis]
MRHNALKHQMRSGNPAVNAWVSLDSDHVGEVLSHAGFDSVTVDLQHGMFGLDRAISLLRSVSAGPATPLARCSRNDAAEIGKLLDAGAYGIICPSIDSPEEARAFVASCRYPSQGVRSFGPARGLLYGGQDYVRHADEEILTWAMIESPSGVARAEEIITTPDLDGIYIGPNDLAFALGNPPNGNIGEEVLGIAAELIALAHDAGRFVGIFTRDGGEAQRLLEMGADLVTPGNDVGLLNAAAAERIAQARQ